MKNCSLLTLQGSSLCVFNVDSAVTDLEPAFGEEPNGLGRGLAFLLEDPLGEVFRLFVRSYRNTTL